MTEAIATALPGLVIRPLDSQDAPALSTLIDENRIHLTRHGDYRDLTTMSEQEVAKTLRNPDVSGHLFGVFENAVLRGVVSLVPVDPPRYGCGYWLAEPATGRSLATASMRALLDYARDRLAATDVYAGVTHGNEASVRLLKRLGFALVERFDAYSRFHISLVRTGDEEFDRSSHHA